MEEFQTRRPKKIKNEHNRWFEESHQKINLNLNQEQRSNDSKLIRNPFLVTNSNGPFSMGVRTNIFSFPSASEFGNEESKGKNSRVGSNMTPGSYKDNNNSWTERRFSK